MAMHTWFECKIRYEKLMEKRVLMQDNELDKNQLPRNAR